MIQYYTLVRAMAQFLIFHFRKECIQINSFPVLHCNVEAHAGGRLVGYKNLHSSSFQTDISRMPLLQWNTGSRAMHWMPYSPTRTLEESLHILRAVQKVVTSRRQSLAITSNGVIYEQVFHSGYRIPYNTSDVLVLVRSYPRAANYLTIVNYATSIVSLDLSQYIIKSEIVLNSAPDTNQGGWTKWQNVVLNSGQVILAKQSKWTH